jgi:ribonucleotide reductase beta subunit family protein with ferritin-like domain
MKEHDELLKKYDVNLCDEFFYLLLNLINENVSKCNDMVEVYKDRKDFEELKADYKKFYDLVLKFLNEFDIKKELMLHQNIYTIVAYLLDNYYSTLEKKIKIYVSNILDVIFLKYRLDISHVRSNEEVKEYLFEKFKDERIVNSLMLILLADTSLSEEYVKNISHEEFENLITNIILLVIYIHKEVI